MSSFRAFSGLRGGSKLLKSSTFKAATAVTLGIGTATLLQYNLPDISQSFANIPATNSFILRASCSAPSKCQDSVVSETKNHALYLTIHVNPSASPPEICRALAKLKSHIDKISPADIRDEDNEILAGIGFGPNFLKRIYSNCHERGVEDFSYIHRKGGAADMPSTGGDIFIHAKCHERGKLFELAQAIMQEMPANSVQGFEDLYGWVYRYGRDLSGFIDGTENVADPTQREEVAISPKTGGSYTIAQKWIHKHKVINTTPDEEMEKWIGRKRADSVALKPKPASSHVARTTGRTDGKGPKPHLIVRQSQPYGSLSGDSGLFFIAYSKTPVAFNWMLDQMAGATEDGLYDHVFHVTDCKTGSYFYFPSQDEMSAIFSGRNSSSNSKPSRFW